jgi:hypothetical protein
MPITGIAEALLPAITVYGISNMRHLKQVTQQMISIQSTFVMVSTIETRTTRFGRLGICNIVK